MDKRKIFWNGCYVSIICYLLLKLTREVLNKEIYFNINYLLYSGIFWGTVYLIIFRDNEENTMHKSDYIELSFISVLIGANVFFILSKSIYNIFSYTISGLLTMLLILTSIIIINRDIKIYNKQREQLHLKK